MARTASVPASSIDAGLSDDDDGGNSSLPDSSTIGIEEEVFFEKDELQFTVSPTPATSNRGADSIFTLENTTSLIVVICFGALLLLFVVICCRSRRARKMARTQNEHKRAVASGDHEAWNLTSPPPADDVMTWDGEGIRLYDEPLKEYSQIGADRAAERRSQLMLSPDEMEYSIQNGVMYELAGHEGTHQRAFGMSGVDVGSELNDPELYNAQRYEVGENAVQTPQYQVGQNIVAGSPNARSSPGNQDTHLDPADGQPHATIPAPPSSLVPPPSPPPLPGTLDSGLQNELIGLFAKFNTNGDTVLDRKELFRACRDDTMKQILTRKHIDPDILYRKLDSNMDGGISVIEFVREMEKLMRASSAQLQLANGPPLPTTAELQQSHLYRIGRPVSQSNSAPRRAKPLGVVMGSSLRSGPRKISVAQPMPAQAVAPLPLARGPSVRQPELSRLVAQTSRPLSFVRGNSVRHPENVDSAPNSRPISFVRGNSIHHTGGIRSAPGSRPISFVRGNSIHPPTRFFATGTKPEQPPTQH